MKTSTYVDDLVDLIKVLKTEFGECPTLTLLGQCLRITVQLPDSDSSTGNVIIEEPDRFLSSVLAYQKPLESMNRQQLLDELEAIAVRCPGLRKQVDALLAQYGSSQ